MNLLLLTTCGTSVLTQKAERETVSWLIAKANAPDLSGADMARLTAHAKARRDEMLNADDATRHALSAEINSIDKINGQYKPQNLQHVLIHTDTAVGRAAFDVIKAVLEGRGEAVQSLTADGLRTDDPEAFRNSLADLTQQLEQWMRWRDDGYRVIFNLTGGFKALGSYLQAYGSLNADGCVFLFERSPALMEIPRLPLKFADMEVFSSHLDVFRRLNAGYDVSEQDAAGIPESLLMSDGKTVLLSVWGEALWPSARSKLFQKALLDPLSAKISFANRDRANKEFDGFGEGDRIDTNAALDALSAHLDLGRELMKSQTFKPLKGNPKPPSTHELYASNRSGAKRVYGRLDGGRFVVHELGDHLK